MTSQKLKTRLLQIFSMGFYLSLTGCDSTNRDPTHVAWPTADALFRDKPNFLGGDSAYSADLGNGRVLWQLGDTFVGIDSQTRPTSVMVQNALAIQTGYNPERAQLEFFSGDDNSIPTAFLSRPEPTWLWPGPAIVIGTQLLLTNFELRPTDSGLGFEAIDGTAFLVSNPESSPDYWQPVELDIPTLPPGVRFGTGALLLEEDYLYGYFAIEPGNHDVYLARWLTSNVEMGNLLSPEFFDPDSGWLNDTSQAHPIIKQVQTEFSVHQDPNTGQFIMISVDGFGGTNIVKRIASAPEGPWSVATFVSRPSEIESRFRLTGLFCESSSISDRRRIGDHLLF